MEEAVAGDMSPAEQPAEQPAEHQEFIAAITADIETYLTTCETGTFKEINASLWVVQRALHGYYNRVGYPRLLKENPAVLMGS